RSTTCKPCSRQPLCEMTSLSPSGESANARGMLPTSNERPAASRHAPVGRQVCFACLPPSRESGEAVCAVTLALASTNSGRQRARTFPTDFLDILFIRLLISLERICSFAGHGTAQLSLKA